MINRLTHATIWVLDHDEALAFYTDKLGFEVRTDQTMDDFRWLTVGPPSQPDLELILLVPGPPMMATEAAEQIKALVVKGHLGSGASEAVTSAQREAVGPTTATRPTTRSSAAASSSCRSPRSASTASRPRSATTRGTGSASRSARPKPR
jgi:hypothetical protein